MRHHRAMKILIFDFNNLMSDIVEELIRRGHDVTSCLSIARKEDAKDYDLIIYWNETNFGEARHFAEYIKGLGKKTIVYQHGRRGIPRTQAPFLEEVLADKVLVWGKRDKDALVKNGTPEDKIFITGCPIFKKLLPRVPHQGKNIVFSPLHWEEESVENHIMVSALRRLQGVNISTKLLNDEHNIEEFDNPIVSDRRLENHIQIIADTLKTADLVVGLVDSTFSLLAEYLDIPVVIADIIMPANHNRNYTVIFSDGCKVVKLEDLEKTIYQQLKHPEELREIRKQACINDGGDIEDPIKTFCDAVEYDLPNRTGNTKPKATYQAVARRLNIRSGCVLGRNCKDNI